MKKFLVLGSLVVLVIALFLAMRPFEISPNNEDQTEVELGDPTELVMEFYNAWHEAVLSTSTDPQTAGLLNSPQLNDEVRSVLVERLADEERLLDPALCQTTAPPRIGSRVSYVENGQAEIHVLARGLDERSPNIAVVTLGGDTGAWLITDIRCAQGESGPEREFSFDREGHLLKSVPPPLNPDYWHLVFEENGINGHTAPLFFDESSTCVDLDGTEATCNPDNFVDATKALVQGEMTESGVEVTRVTLLP